MVDGDFYTKPRLIEFRWDMFNEMNCISKKGAILSSDSLRPPWAGLIYELVNLLHPTGTSNMSIENMGQAHNAKYQPPTSLVSYLPTSWVPYAELMRLDRPGGFYALYVPCLFGVLYAAVTRPVPASLALIADRAINLLFCCLLARGTACT